MPTVVITDHVFPSLEIEQELLGAIGATVVSLQARSEVDLLDAVTDADALLVCYAPVTDRVIRRMTRCRIIARYGIGVDNVDLGAATAKGIVVTNVPDYCVDEVSDHALALLLACARRIPALAGRVRGGRWNARDAAPMHRLRGQTLGLVGFGKIPRRLADKARALGLEVMAFDPYVAGEEMEARGVQKTSLHGLLARSDFVSVHAPLAPETRGMIAEAQLRAMKRSAYLINTARGPLVLESASSVRSRKNGSRALHWTSCSTSRPRPTTPYSASRMSSLRRTWHSIPRSRSRNCSGRQPKKSSARSRDGRRARR